MASSLHRATLCRAASYRSRGGCRPLLPPEKKQARLDSDRPLRRVSTDIVLPPPRPSLRFTPEEVGVALAELGQLGGDDRLAVALVRVGAEVALVVVLRPPEALVRH